MAEDWGVLDGFGSEVENFAILLGVAPTSASGALGGIVASLEGVALGNISNMPSISPAW